MPVGVHAGGEQGVDVHDAAALADLQHQRIGGHERVRAAVQRPGPERLDLLVEVAGHLADLRPRQRVIPRDSASFSIRRVRHPEQVARRHHRWSALPRRGGGAPAASPGNSCPSAASGSHVQRAGPGIEVAVPVAVADVHPVRARHAVRGAADRVGLRGHERVDERGQHRAQQIRRRGRELVVQKAGRVDTAGAVTVVSPSEALWEVFQRITRWPPYRLRHAHHRAGRYTTLLDATAAARSGGALTAKHRSRNGQTIPRWA